MSLTQNAECQKYNGKIRSQFSHTPPLVNTYLNHSFSDQQFYKQALDCYLYRKVFLRFRRNEGTGRAWAKSNRALHQHGGSNCTQVHCRRMCGYYYRQPDSEHWVREENWTERCLSSHTNSPISNHHPLPLNSLSQANCMFPLSKATLNDKQKTTVTWSIPSMTTDRTKHALWAPGAGSTL